MRTIFEKGDEVIRVRGDHYGMVVGDIDIVEEVHTQNIIQSISLRKYGKGHSNKGLEHTDKHLNNRGFSKDE